MPLSSSVLPGARSQAHSRSLCARLSELLPIVAACRPGVASASPTANPTVAAATTASAPTPEPHLFIPRMTPPSTVRIPSPAVAGAAQLDVALEGLELEIGAPRSEGEPEPFAALRLGERHREGGLELAVEGRDRDVGVRLGGQRDED